MLKDHKAVTPVRLEPAAPRSRVKHSTTEPLRSHNDFVRINKIKDITAINRKTGQHVKKTFSYASRTTGMKLQFSCQITLKQINNLKLT